MTQEKNGYVDYWNELRGFGFCRVEGETERYFTHVTNIVFGAPQSGMAATFEVGKSSRGLVAVNVRVGAQ